jgi:hypothetical protein
MPGYRGFKARKTLARKEAAPRRSDLIRAVPWGSRRLRGHQIERLYLDQLGADERFLRLRGDARDSMVLFARELARRADYEGGWARPTRAVLCGAARRSESTWKACRRRLEAWGYLGTVYEGCVRWLEEESRNDAAVYVLALPRKARIGRRRALALPLTRPPTGPRRGFRIPPPARGPAGDSGARCARPDRRGRRARAIRGPRAGPGGAAPAGAVARALRRGPGQSITEGWVSHLSAPFVAAGWQPADLAWAIDHEPGGAGYPYLVDNVRDPVAWIRWRLSAWLLPGEAGLALPARDPVTGRLAPRGEIPWTQARPRPSRSQVLAAARELEQAQAARLRAERAAAAAAAVDPRPRVTAIFEQMGWHRPRPIDGTELTSS